MSKLPPGDEAIKAACEPLVAIGVLHMRLEAVVSDVIHAFLQAEGFEVEADDPRFSIDQRGYRHRTHPGRHRLVSKWVPDA